jgi:hypothetical protein
MKYFHLTGILDYIKPLYLYPGKKKKSFAVLIGSVDNPRSEIIWNINRV